ncbi:hypothetical protein B9Z65_6183 [Elsinoe australis]|uniref:Uncharacterized protein n=1 Tax=Elsinoe australis TaxID=40998 RepID=A0A2P8A7X1_9PEZI|nr:hypothetical protein B9Z65_6183 [Elsinoe australis]
MPKYSFEVAKAVLSETDKNRILAIYLSMENPNSITDWSTATAAFGAASEDSMRVMLRSALKKIKDAGGEIAADGSTVPATPAKKGGPGSKRKADGDATTTPAKTPKKGRGKKVKDEPVVEDDEAEAMAGEDADMGENINVKLEGNEIA